MTDRTHTAALARMHKDVPKFGHTREDKIERVKAAGELVTSLLAKIKETTPEPDRRVDR